MTAAKSVPSKRGGFGKLSSQTKLHVPPNWSTNHCSFYQTFRMSSPLHKRKDPYWRLSGKGSACNAIKHDEKDSDQRTHYAKKSTDQPWRT